MKEILFRGKRVDGKGWAYGLPTYILEENILEMRNKLYDSVGGYMGYSRYDVIPETVGQFIGREDMNRDKIFKDDLLSTKERDVLFQVVWDNESCGFKFKSIETGTLFEIDSSVEKLEVIGNIHEKGKWNGRKIHKT